jgi:hypothetical protein
MNRRQFLIAGAAVAASTAGGIATARALRPAADLAALAAELEPLRGRALATTAGWPPFKVLSHLAQSIELSLAGYPQLKSAFFRHTAGAAAFSVFAASGAMRHPLTEAIPGAPGLPDTGDTDAALNRLLAALDAFAAHEGALAPHFAYGVLDKAEYAQAHAMHIRDHLRLFQAWGPPRVA